MNRRWVAPGGWQVMAIRLNGAPQLRISCFGFVRDYCSTVAELERWVALEDLVEVVEIEPRT